MVYIYMQQQWRRQQQHMRTNWNKRLNISNTTLCWSSLWSVSKIKLKPWEFEERFCQRLFPHSNITCIQTISRQCTCTWGTRCSLVVRKPRWSWRIHQGRCWTCTGRAGEVKNLTWRLLGKPTEGRQKNDKRWCCRKEISTVWSGITFKWLTLAMTDRCDRASSMLNQTPMFWARSATGRRYSHANLWASRRISTQLLRSAKSGARGNAATKMVMNPNWSTAAQ